MRAVQILGDKESPRVVVNDAMLTPTVADDKLLIKVCAAGITGDEVTWPELYETKSRIPGHDISGVIAAVGPAYTGSLTVGQEVFVLIAAETGEGQAEFAVCSPEEAAPKPRSISHAEAAALPIPLLTAWEAASDYCKLTTGMRVLVTGASGAVGILFVQMAIRMGCKVIALASAQHHDALRTFGADVVDYHTSNWHQAVSGMDVVFDTVGGDILTTTWECVHDTGIIVTVGDPAPPWAFSDDTPVELARHPNVRYKHFIVSPNSTRLEETAKMVDDGSLKPLAIKSFPLADATAAWAYARQRNRGHKVVLDIAH